MQVCACGQGDCDHGAFGDSHRGQKVVCSQRATYFSGGDIEGRHLLSIKPSAQSKNASAQNLCNLNAFDRIEFGLDHTNQVVGDVVGGDFVAVKAKVHGVNGLTHLYRENRLLRLWR